MVVNYLSSQPNRVGYQASTKQGQVLTSAHLPPKKVAYAMTGGAIWAIPNSSELSITLAKAGSLRSKYPMNRRRNTISSTSGASNR